MGQKKNDIIIDVVGLFKYYLRWSWLIILCALLGGGSFLAASKLLITPQYESKTMLYVLSKATSITSFAEIQIGDALTTDLIVIATSKPVLDGTIVSIREEHGIELSRKTILEMISVNNRNDTRILEISAKSPDPWLASIVANTVREETAKQMAFIMKTDIPTTIEQAEPSLLPVSPSSARNTILGMAGFTALALGILGMLFVMNDHIKTEDDVETYLDLKVLVVIPEDEDLSRKRKTRKRK